MDMSSNRPYLLRALYQWICDNSTTPYIVVDCQYPGVSVPAEYIKDGNIVLNLSPAACDQLVIENDYLTCMCRFAGEARQIIAPISSVLAIYARENGQGMVFATEQPGQSSGSDQGGVEESQERKQPPTLKLVD